MLPLVFFMLLLVGCDAKKTVDESVYTESSAQAMLDRAAGVIAASNDKEALIQLQSLSNQRLSLEQDRWVRDQIIARYQEARDFNEIIRYIHEREQFKHIAPEEKAQNILDTADAYHRLSYNHWARVFGVGSPYRKSRDAFKAQKYYMEFMQKYPDDARIPSVKKELAELDKYIQQYNILLEKHRKFRESKRLNPSA